MRGAEPASEESETLEDAVFGVIGVLARVIWDALNAYYGPSLGRPCAEGRLVYEPENPAENNDFFTAQLGPAGAVTDMANRTGFVNGWFAPDAGHGAHEGPSDKPLSRVMPDALDAGSESGVSLFLPIPLGDRGTQQTTACSRLWARASASTTSSCSARGAQRPKT